MNRITLISACRLGIPCRYDGRASPHRLDEETIEALGPSLVPVCPEQLGGLPTPRVPAEIQGGDGFDVLAGRARVVSRDGRDVTEHFVRGARQVLRITRITGATRMILQARSPSCGCRQIYDGTFGDVLVEGVGVTAALLRLETEIELTELVCEHK